MPRPQTIQIYLPAGDPRGMRVAEITTRIVRVIEVPRSQLADFLKMPEAQQVGVYFLMGELSEAGLPRAYIGQSGNVGTRLVQHNQGKDFWNRALVVISLTNSMTQTHALFLEWFAIAEATKAGRYSLENGNTGSQPYTPAPLQADCHEIHETAATLLATLGQPIFEPLTGSQTHANDEGEKVTLFYCKGPAANGVGEYTSEGFVVHKGSTARIEIVASIKGTSQERFRQQLVTDGVLALNGDNYVFTRDHLFASPSMAAIAVLGRSANGWLEWKTEQGQTLDGAKRQVVGVVG
jgi:hypothetical protein